jgi:putative ABC transport system permease protein
MSDDLPPSSLRAEAQPRSVAANPSIEADSRYGWGLAYDLALHHFVRRRALMLITTAGMSLSLVLVALQLSVYSGVFGQITTYIDHVGADLWVLQKGSADLFATSFVSRETEWVVSAVPGVEAATGIYAVYTSVTVRGTHTGVYIIGFDPATGDGGPWALAGQSRDFSPTALRADEIIVDENFARHLGLEVGDSFPLLDRTFRIAALSSQTSALGCQYLFLRRDALGSLWSGAGAVYTHLLVSLRAGADHQAVLLAIARGVPECRVVSSRDLARSTRRFVGFFILPVLGLVTVVAAIIALAISAFSIFNLTLARLEEYALLRALGASSNWLTGVVLAQASLVTFLGVAIGLPIALILTKYANWQVMGLNCRLSSQAALLLIASAAGIASLTSVLPILRLRRVDPVVLFRA